MECCFSWKNFNNMLQRALRCLVKDVCFGCFRRIVSGKYWLSKGAFALRTFGSVNANAARRNFAFFSGYYTLFIDVPSICAEDTSTLFLPSCFCFIRWALARILRSDSVHCCACSTHPLRSFWSLLLLTSRNLNFCDRRTGFLIKFKTTVFLFHAFQGKLWKNFVVGNFDVFKALYLCLKYWD